MRLYSNLNTYIDKVADKVSTHLSNYLLTEEQTGYILDLVKESLQIEHDYYSSFGYSTWLTDEDTESELANDRVALFISRYILSKYSSLILYTASNMSLSTDRVEIETRVGKDKNIGNNSTHAEGTNNNTVDNQSNTKNNSKSTSEDSPIGVSLASDINTPRVKDESESEDNSTLNTTSEGFSESDITNNNTNNRDYNEDINRVHKDPNEDWRLIKEEFYKTYSNIASDVFIVITEEINSLL